MRWLSFFLLLLMTGANVLAQNRWPISLQPTPTELASFGEQLHGVKLVSIGEDNVTSKETLRLKVSLIKYLHEELGFTLLLMPGTLYDAQKSRTALKAGARKADAFAMAWPPDLVENANMMPLMTYLEQQVSETGGLEYSGYEILQTGNIPQTTRREDLQHAMTKVNALLDADHFPILHRLMIDPASALVERADEETKIGLITEIAEIRNRFTDRNPRREDFLLWAQQLNDIEDLFIMMWALHDSGNMKEAMEYRQSQMAEKIRSLKKELYPETKIIIWGNNADLGSSLGDSLSRWYGDSYMQILVKESAGDNVVKPTLEISGQGEESEKTSKSVMLLMPKVKDNGQMNR